MSKKVGLIAGAFDVIHPGYILMGKYPITSCKKWYNTMGGELWTTSQLYRLEGVLC